MYRRICSLLLLSAAFAAGCRSTDTTAVSTYAEAAVLCEKVLPVTGTFLNLAYQDVRNKYTNPPGSDNTDPALWRAKVSEMKKMGMEYLVLMAVANEGLSYYPSSLMEWQYPKWRQSPVEAIMEAASENGMKVFMSTGWAKDQDDNLRDPAIKGRQIEMMTELARIYGRHPAMYGWYLPVEDCFGPVLSDYAVDAVNALTAKARELTPGKKILISPYGIFNSDFDDPRYAEQVCRLDVDIIAYQDEIGCVREKYPLTRLRENWKKLREIHDKAGIEMWANCESFTWEGNTNDRASALVPASFSRFLSQQIAASAGGVDRIISFMFVGIYDDPSSEYRLGQPRLSAQAHSEYMSWLAGEKYWKVVENSLRGVYGQAASEDPGNVRWKKFPQGISEVIVAVDQECAIESVLVRMLNCRKDEITPPDKLSLSVSDDGINYRMIRITDAPSFVNNRHDAYIDHILFDDLGIQSGIIKIKVAFHSQNTTFMDELIINPEI